MTGNCYILSGMQRNHALKLMMFLMCCCHCLHAFDQNIAGTYSFVKPDGVEQITIHIWGAGGGGGGSELSATPGIAGGGGGGAYSRVVISGLPTAETTYTDAVVVGAGGAGGIGSANGDDGLDSTVTVDATTYIAAGGKGGGGTTADGLGTAGPGGTNLDSFGDITYPGGSGAAGSVGASGGGGGAAGTMEPGNDAINDSAGTGGNADGGNGAAGLTSTSNGTDAAINGGGGSGAFGDVALDRDGGRGADGRVKIIFHPAPIGISKDPGRDLSFGAFVGGTAGTVEIAATDAGERTAGGGIVLLSSSPGQSASFTITGHETATFLAVVTGDSELSHSSEPDTIPIEYLVDYSNIDREIMAAGAQVFVGGRLTLNGTEAAGSYNANATIFVGYD